MDKVSPDITESNAEGDISIAISEADSESPLAKRRDGETDQSMSTTGQDDLPAANDLSLSSPQCSSTIITKGNYQESLQICSQKTTSVSVLEPIAAQKVGETHKTGKACSENKGRLGSSSVRESGVRTDQLEIGAAQQRNAPTMLTAFSLGAITERLSLLNSHGGALIEGEDGESERRRFRAKINPASNNQAEEELRKHIR